MCTSGCTSYHFFVPVALYQCFSLVQAWYTYWYTPECLEPRMNAHFVPVASCCTSKCGTELEQLSITVYT